MNVMQLSVFVANKAGRVSGVTDALADASINIRGFSVSDTADYGIARVIVDDPNSAREVLADAGFTVKMTEVLCVDLPDVPGSLAHVLRTVANTGANIEYMYSLISTYMIINVDDLESAQRLLEGTDVRLVTQEEISAS